MKKAIISGAQGLVGSAAVKHLSELGWQVIGLDNDSRKKMFGDHASTADTGRKLMEQYPNFSILDIDIRDLEGIEAVFKEHADVELIYHCAAQPAHEFATNNLIADFHINATGTVYMLYAFKKYCPDAVLPAPPATTEFCADAVLLFPPPTVAY